MAFDFAVLPQVLYNPREAFESLHRHTTLTEGIIMAIVMTIIAYIISLGTGIVFDAVAIVMAVIIGVVLLLITSVLSAYIAGAMGGKSDVEKTVGLLGYGTVLTVISAIVGLVLYFAMGESLSAIATNPLAMSTVALGVIGVALVLGIVFLLWALWINGTAVAQANRTSFGRGVASYIISVIIYGIILVPVLNFIVPVF